MGFESTRLIAVLRDYERAMQPSSVALTRHQLSCLLSLSLRQSRPLQCKVLIRRRSNYIEGNEESTAQTTLGARGLAAVTSLRMGLRLRVSRRAMYSLRQHSDDIRWPSDEDFNDKSTYTRWRQLQ